MKNLLCSVTISLGVLASNATAEQMLTVDGTEYPLSVLMASCQSETDDPAEQVACFNNISKLLIEQESKEQAVSVPEALDALRTAAQVQNSETGLSISGSDCRIQIVYFGNYFHISRRNISTIDFFSATFDASKLRQGQLTPATGGQAPTSRAVLESGATALVTGGVALDSAQHNFPPRPPRMTIEEYANDLVNQLPGRDAQDFEFVLIHPMRRQDSAAIWSAFETFVSTCKQQAA